MPYSREASKNLDELKRADEAIKRRLEAQEDNYRDLGLSENEIQDRLAADKWNFQKEWLDDRYPGENVSPHVFNGLSPNGARDRIAEIKSSPRLRSTIEQNSNEMENEDEMEQSM